MPKDLRKKAARLMPGAKARDVWGRGDLRLRAELDAEWARSWARALSAYERHPLDFYCAYRFLDRHPANQRRPRLGTATGLGPGSRLHENLHFDVVKVDPRTGRVEHEKGSLVPDRKRNTATAVWVEWGPYDEAEGMPSHDARTDTGGSSFEEAVVRLAHNVYVLYGGEADIPSTARLRKRDRW